MHVLCKYAFFCCLFSLFFWRKDYEPIETVSKPAVQRKNVVKQADIAWPIMPGLGQTVTIESYRPSWTRTKARRRHANHGHDKRCGPWHLERLPQRVAHTISSSAIEPQSQPSLRSWVQLPRHPYTDFQSICSHTADRATAGGYRLR